MFNLTDCHQLIVKENQSNNITVLAIEDLAIDYKTIGFDRLSISQLIIMIN